MDDFPTSLRTNNPLPVGKYFRFLTSARTIQQSSVSPPRKAWASWRHLRPSILLTRISNLCCLLPFFPSPCAISYRIPPKSAAKSIGTPKPPRPSSSRNPIQEREETYHCTLLQLVYFIISPAFTHCQWTAFQPASHCSKSGFPACYFSTLAGAEAPLMATDNE
jgi:hypothetical protein